MARKKTLPDELPLAELSAPTRPPAPPAFDPATLPAILEYHPAGASAPWRVERFAAFVTEFNFGAAAERAGGWPGAMIWFHEVAQAYSRGWLLSRQLFGITPCILPDDAHLDDSRVFTRAELLQQHGLTGEELSAELGALRTLTERREITPEIKKETLETPPAAVLALDDDLLRKHGFPESMFAVKIWNGAKEGETFRPSADNRVERDWFAQKVSEWDKMLSSPFASSIAREALMNDLYLRRVAMDMSALTPSHPRFKDLSVLKKDLESAFQSQRKILQEMFPAMNIAGRESQVTTFDMFGKALRAYRANGDTRLFDGIFTATEMMTDLTASIQAPDVGYRFGLTAALIEARRGLHDPEWRSAFPHRVLRKMDLGFRVGVEQARLAQNETLVDMENGVEPGEGSNFPDLHLL